MELVDILENPLPAGGVVHPVEVGRVRLRVARWEPGGLLRGTVLVCPGRSEFIEKYAEVVRDLLDRGFVTVVMDWRGQGGSTRLLADPRKGHVRSFDAYRDDLDGVVDQVLRRRCPGPYFAIGHSMGGAIALDHAAVRPGIFERLVLSAPMLSVIAPRGARRVAAAVTRMGGGSAYVPGGSAKSWMLRPFADNGLTSDPRRYAIFGALAREAPHLILGAPTFGWLHAAFVVMRRLESPVVLQRIKTPVLAVACGSDRVVGTPATERVMRQLKFGHTVVVPRALHEILMEADDLRAQFWAAFDSFVPGSRA